MSSRVRILCALTACLPLLFSACKSTGSKVELDHPLRVFLDLERSQFQPGEALLAEVMVLNVADEPMRATVPNAESVTFWLAEPDGLGGVKAMPVFSPKEDLRAVDSLASDDLWRRTFVLPSATLTSGTFTLIASYDSDPARLIGGGYQGAARGRTFSVTGETKLQRDRDGIVLKQEAHRVAGRYLGQGWVIDEGRMIRNEAGFLDWAFTARSSATGEQRAVVVNSYLGGVRTEADPTLLRKTREELPPPNLGRLADR
jgi:hypothetical protein